MQKRLVGGAGASPRSAGWLLPCCVGTRTSPHRGRQVPDKAASGWRCFNLPASSSPELRPGFSAAVPSTRHCPTRQRGGILATQRVPQPLLCCMHGVWGCCMANSPGPPLLPSTARAVTHLSLLAPPLCAQGRCRDAGCPPGARRGHGPGMARGRGGSRRLRRGGETRGITMVNSPELWCF